jgi:hypothetical protein
MNKPEVKILAVSNVYCRLMNFVKKGDKEHGHYHDYDHGTLLASGKLLVEKLDDNGEIIYSKVFTAPSFIFIAKDSQHILTALEDNTVATCIHALRTIDETIIDPDFYIEEKELSDTFEGSSKEKPTIGLEMKERGLKYKNLAYLEK